MSDSSTMDHEVQAAPVYWHFPLSVNCHKTSLALAETGFHVDRRVVDLLTAQHLEPEYMAVNPRGLVPCLQLAGGEAVADSKDIMLYLAEHAKGRIEFLPADASARATAEAWLALGQALPIERLTYARKALPGGAGLIALRIATLQRWLADPATPPELLPYYQRRLDGYRDKQGGFQARSEADYTDALREALEAEVIGTVDRLESLLASDARPFVAGSAYSVADCIWTALLARLHLAGLAAWFEDRPALAAYFTRMRERPSYAAAGVRHERLRS